MHRTLQETNEKRGRHDRRKRRFGFLCFCLAIALMLPSWTASADAAGRTARSGEDRISPVEVGSHIRLGATEANPEGYDFTVLDITKDQAGGQESVALLFYSSPEGVGAADQQFDAKDDSNPDAEAQYYGCNLWRLSDLYRALNGADQQENDDTHGAEITAAVEFYTALRSKPEEWGALLPTPAETDDRYAGKVGLVDGVQYSNSPLSDGERITLLSEREYNRYHSRSYPGFSWNDGIHLWWTKTGGNDSYYVRYLKDDDPEESLDWEVYYHYAKETARVRPAVRLILDAVEFGSGDGTPEQPFEDITLRPGLDEVTLAGTPENGVTLTAQVSPSGVTAAGGCAYQWYRLSSESSQDRTVIEQATGAAYTLTTEDVGSYVQVEAKGQDDYWGTVRRTIGPIEKGTQKAPEGKELPAKEDFLVRADSVVLTVTASGLEYAATTDSALAATSPDALSWKVQPAFTDLEEDTDYYVYLRKSENDGYYASPPAAPFRITTRSGAEDLVEFRLRVESWDPGRTVSAKVYCGGTEVEAQTACSTTAGIGLSRQTVLVTVSGSGVTTAGPWSMRLSKDAHTDVAISQLFLTNGGIDLTQSSSSTLSLIRMRAGDVDGDGAVTLADRLCLLSANYYGRRIDSFEEPAQRSAARRLDLDGDGFVGETDRAILMSARNFGQGLIRLYGDQ